MKKVSTYAWVLAAAIIGWGGLWIVASGTRLVVSKMAVLSSSPSSSNLANVISVTNVASIIEADSIDAKKSTSQNVISIVGGGNTSNTVIKIIIGGDVMFDRHVRALADKQGYDSILAGVAPLFHSADISVVNLEGPITNFTSRTLFASGQTSKELSFTFASTTAAALKNAGISLVSLANNHTYNFGAVGLSQTKDFLSSAQINWFGDPNNASTTEKVICQDACFAFVGYHEFTPGFDRILSDVTRLSHRGYTVIVMPHWGDEYATTSPVRIKEKARQLVDAGANIIIGSHPHVIEDKEWINNVPVVYSLGNLVFDQYFSKDVENGNIAELTFKIDTHKISNGYGTAQLEKIALQNVLINRDSGPVLVGDPVEFKL